MMLLRRVVDSDVYFPLWNLGSECSSRVRPRVLIRNASKERELLQLYHSVSVEAKYTPRQKLLSMNWFSCRWNESTQLENTESIERV